MGRACSPAVRRSRCADRGAGRRTRLVWVWPASCWSTNIGCGLAPVRCWRFSRSARRAVVSVGMGGASAALRGADGPAGADRGRGTPLRLGARRGSAVVAPLGGPWALLGGIAMESAGDARAGLAGRRLARRASWWSPSTPRLVGAFLLRSVASVALAARPRGPRSGVVLVGTGARAGVDGAGRARSARRHRRTATARQAASEALTEGLVGQRLDLVVWGESSVGVDLTRPTPRPAGSPGRITPTGGATCWSTSTPAHPSGGIYKSSVLIGPRWCARLVCEDPAGALRRVCAAAIAAGLGHPAYQGRRRGPSARRRAGRAAHGRPLALGPLISFETTFSDLPRRVVRLGAELLAYQSSTSSYQGSWAQPQLASMAAVHAAETGHPAVHAGTSGVSSAFDVRGRELDGRPPLTAAYWSSMFRWGLGVTLYDRLGDWPIVLSLLILYGVVWTISTSVLDGARRWRVPIRATDPRRWRGRRCRRRAGPP